MADWAVRCNDWGGCSVAYDMRGVAAKPEVWPDRAGFEKANLAFVSGAERLEDAAKSGDKAAFAAAFTAAQTCGGCHRTYKER